jgi:ribose transport system permease protein
MASSSTAECSSLTPALKRIVRSYNPAGFLPAVLTVLLIGFAIFVPNFLAVQNFLNILRSSSYLVIIAAGQMLVLIVGGFDLSQGAVVALTSVSSALVMAGLKDTFAGHPDFIILCGVLAGSGCGVIVGLVNGICVAFLRISPFMVTLGTMSIATGFALLLTSGIPVYGLPKSYVESFGRGLLWQLPAPFYLAAAVVAVIWVMQNYTRMGRYNLAIGGNVEAATASGVPAKTYLILAYVSCSTLASLSGLALTAQIGSGQAVINAQLTLESIATAVIAGVSIRGGVGRVEMVILSAILLPTLSDVMDLLKIDPRIQPILLGIIVVVAVALEELSQRRRRVSETSFARVNAGSGRSAERQSETLNGISILLLPIVIVGMEGAVSLIEPTVPSLHNIVNVLVQSSYLFLFASAQMVVILAGGFDLSLGMAVSIISVATALATTGLATQGTPIWLVVTAGLAVGLGGGMLVGVFNGLFVSWLGLNPFVVTLGSFNICYGLALTISGGRPVFDVPDAFSRLLYDGTFIPGIPIPVTLAIVVAVFLHFLLGRTVFGRALYLIGSNPRAAHLAGLPVKRYLFLAYLTCSVLAAFGSLMLTARTGSGEPNLGGSLMLESIAAAVIGGISLQGGVGSILPVALGSIFVTALSNAMNLLEVGGYIQQIALGCVIVVAIAGRRE